jgi:hypothetical protein
MEKMSYPKFLKKTFVYAKMRNFLDSKMNEKELAARMKKAKISQTSLENEVFESSPSCHSSANTDPGTLQKDPPPPAPPRPVL